MAQNAFYKQAQSGLRDLVRLIGQLIWSHDVFISYRWEVRSKAYASELAKRLGERGLDCFLDEENLPKGESIPLLLRVALRRSRMLILLATADVLSSVWIPQELKAFTDPRESKALFFRRRRIIVPINIGGAIADYPLDVAPWTVLRDRNRIEETLEALENGLPSDHVVQEIDRSFMFTRQRARASIFLLSASLLLFGLSLAAVFSARSAVETRRKAQADTAALQREGEKRQSELQKAQELTARAQRSETESRANADGANYQAARTYGLAAAVMGEREPFNALSNGIRAYATGIRTSSGVPPEAMVGLTSAVDRLYSCQLFRGRGAGNAVAYLSRSDQILTGSADGTVALWEVATGRRLRSFGTDIPPGQFGERITQIQTSSDERYVLAQTMLGTIRVWEISTGRELNHTSQQLGLLYAAAISPSNSHFVAVGYELAVGSPPKGYLFKIGSDVPIATLRDHTQAIRAVSYSPNGTSFVTASDDGSILSWDVSGQLLKRIGVLRAKIFSVEHSKGGDSLLTMSSDGVLRSWDLTEGEGQEPRTLTVITQASDQELSFTARYSNGDETIVLVSHSPQANSVQILKMDTPIKRMELRSPLVSGRVITAAISKDGKVIAVSYERGGAILWDIASGEPIKHLSDAGDAGSMAFSPTGDYALLTGSFSGPVRLWRVSVLNSWPILRAATSTIERARTLSPNSFVNTEAASALDVSQARASLDGRRIALLSRNRSVTLIDRTSKRVQTIVDSEQINSISFSKHGNLFAGCLGNGAVGVWDAQTGHKVFTLTRPGKPAVGPLTLGTNQQVEHGDGSVTFSGAGGHCLTVLFSPRGDYMAALYSDGELAKWLSKEGSWLRNIPVPADATTAAWSPNGLNVAIGTASGQTTIITADAGRTVWRRKYNEGRVWSVEFSNGGRTLASVGNDRVVRLINAEDGRLDRAMEGHSAEVISARFSSDDQLLVTASWDGTVRVWRVPDGAVLGAFHIHQEKVWFAEFLNREADLLSVGDDGAAKVYPSSMQRFVDRACSLIQHQPEYHDVAPYVRYLIEAYGGLTKHGLDCQGSAR